MLAVVLFFTLAVRLRVDGEKHEVERAADFFGRGHAILRKAFGDISRDHTVKIVFEVRILQLRTHTKRISDAPRHNDVEELVHLYVVRFRFKLQHVPQHLVFRHDNSLVKNRRRVYFCIGGNFALRDAVVLETII